MTVCPVILVLLATMSTADGAPDPSLGVPRPGAPTGGLPGTAIPPTSILAAPMAPPTSAVTPAATAPAPRATTAVPSQPRRQAAQVRDEDEEGDVQSGLLMDAPSPGSRARTAAWASTGLTT